MVSLKTAFNRCFSMLEKQKFRSLALSCNRTLSTSHQVQTLASFLREYFAFNTNSGINTVVFCDERKTASSFLNEFRESKIPWTCRMEGQFKHNTVSYSIKPGYLFYKILSLNCPKILFVLHMIITCITEIILFQDFFVLCLTGLDWDTTPIIHVSSSFTFDVGPLKVRGLVGDITNLTVDAIVNSSNKSLDLRKGQYSISVLCVIWSSSALWTRQTYFNSKQSKRWLCESSYMYIPVYQCNSTF